MRKILIDVSLLVLPIICLAANICIREWIRNITCFFLFFLPPECAGLCLTAMMLDPGFLVVETEFSQDYWWVFKPICKMWFFRNEPDVISIIHKLLSFVSLVNLHKFHVERGEKTCFCPASEYVLFSGVVS